MVEKLQNLIVDRGLTQTVFEPMAGLPENRISKWAGGQGEPTARQALRMARQLGVSVEYLIDDQLDRDPGAPSVPLSLQDQMILEAYRAFGFQEAWRRLHPTPPEGFVPYRSQTNDDVPER